MKKILKTLLSCAVITALASSAVMAGEIGDDGMDTTGGNTVSIPKTLSVYNEDFEKSYIPDVTYTFSITGKNVTTTDTVTDSNGNSAAVIQGVNGALVDTEATVTFASQEVTEMGEGELSKEVVGAIEFEFDPTAFPAPGIYRYVITDETDLEDLYNAGITRIGSYDTTRDLDVYVVNDGGTLAIDGYVLSNTTDGTITELTGKDPGWIQNPGDTDDIEFPGTPGGPGDPNATGDATMKGVDYYQTFNISVTKTVEGDMVTDPTNEFPFSIALSNSNANAAVPAQVYAGKGTVANNTAATTNASYTTTLANGETYRIYGLNPFAVATATETNNTTQSCIVSSTDGSVTAANELLAGNNATLTFGDNAVSDYADINDTTDISNVEAAGDYVDLGVTNTFDSPDITGVIMTVAPFVAVFVAAAALFVVALIKKNNKKNAENA